MAEDLPLWTWGELLAATGGAPEGEAKAGVTGISIDTRTLAPGDLFVALKGDNQDGHVYVTKAFEKGAAAALVSADYVTPAGAGLLIRVASADGDPVLKALERLGVAARARLSAEARIIAVTGSVGKTSTKEMLRVCLLSVDPHTHASDKSYNNHWGVPLTLARMPRDTRYGVFEIGMNHPGEIRPLTKMVRPHVAIVTTVGPVHLGFFKSVEEIADAKAEIFEGLEAPAMGSDPTLTQGETGLRMGSDPIAGEPPRGVAVLPAHNPHFERLRAAALATGAAIVDFGVVSGPDSRFPDFGASESRAKTSVGTEVRPIVRGVYARWYYDIGALGDHQILNSLATLATIEAIDLDPATCAQALTKFSAGEGRGALMRIPVPGGQIALLDEAYNANPVSMDAALRVIALLATLEGGARRIAVLGDMRELGEQSAQLHRDLKAPIEAARIDKVFACGPFMKGLFDELPKERQGAWAEKSTDLIPYLLAPGVLQPGDVIMVKGSLGTRMAPIVDALKKHLTDWQNGAKPVSPDG